MNNEKAREFFSAYYDGTLEPGLQQTLEQKLRTDYVLASDYAAFVETMQELDAMRFEEIEIPSNLNHKIAARLEQVQATKPSLAASWSMWLRGLALGGLATAAVVLGVVGITSMSANQAPLATGELLPAPKVEVNADQLNFSYRDGSVHLSYRPTSPKTVVISSGTNGKEIQRFALDGKRLESPLTNPLPDPALLEVRVLGEDKRVMVALPGTSRRGEKSGAGSVADMAAALADYYRIPVLLEVEDTSKGVTWSFAEIDAREAATKAVQEHGYSVDQRPSGMLVVLRG